MDKKIADGTNTLFYREEGSGLPVVLLHGFAEDGAIWSNQSDYLRSGFRLIIPDLPGTGDSIPTSYSSASSPTPTSQSSAANISMESMAENVLTILNHEGIDKCVLIGHSMGGYATLAFAEKYPDRLKGFGLFHSTAYPDSEEKKSARRKSIDFIRNNGSAPFIRQSTPNLFAAGTRTSRPDLIQSTIDRYSGFAPKALIAWYEAMIRRPDRTAVLRDAATPVLFVIGKDDQAVLPEQTLQQSHLPSLTHIHILQRSAHMGMLEEPDKSNGLLQSFLNFVIHT
ncbi:alpha/beta fold hydrolase [Puia sp. P3]|uniref:alpha/beta fold hydrolase n=1 Tax=Puia sp. P3 TaxID=3423952 RepID=UPI003D66415C